MNSSQRLFVTPEEHARRMAEQNRHPHGGEGDCGGSEGHGTPELMRKRAEERNGRNAGKGNERKDAVTSRDCKNPEPTKRAPKESAPADTRMSDKQRKSIDMSREQIVSAMRLSFVLGEPACRKYGMPSPYGKRGF